MTETVTGYSPRLKELNAMSRLDLTAVLNRVLPMVNPSRMDGDRIKTLILRAEAGER